MKADELGTTLAQQAFLYDDPAAYLAGVNDALALVAAQGQDSGDEEDASSPSRIRPSA